MSSTREPFFLAIDIGTSSARAALFDPRLRRVPGSLTQIAHAPTYSADGAAELDPAMLEASVHRCLAATLPRAGSRGVTAVGVSCFWHSLIGCDARGNALTPIYTWADSRCRADAARLREEQSEKEYHARTGCMLRASYWPAKLLWLARTRRGLFRRVARWLSPADWLQHRFCDQNGVTSHGMATGTGLYDPRQLGWDKASVRLSGISLDQLPAITTDPLTLNAASRRRYPALGEARWWPGIGDGAASNLGCGATLTGRAAINVGTSAAFRVMRDGAAARAPFGLFCYRVDPKRYLIGGAVSNAGNLRAWCRRELQLPESEKALDAALAVRPGPIESLVVLPFWSAERAPTWCEDLGGMVAGLSQNTTALDLLQATTEAVYHRLGLIADLAVPESGAGGRAVTKILVSGGILKSAHLLQRLADVLGRPVHPSAEPEASLRGAAVYAAEMEGIDVRRIEQSDPRSGRAIRPRRRHAAEYAQERARQVRLENALRGQEF